ncbi:hypothetical protein Tco_1159795 [Tanacetum coccineum]
MVAAKIHPWNALKFALSIPKFVLISVHDYNVPSFLLKNGYFTGKKMAEAELEEVHAYKEYEHRLTNDMVAYALKSDGVMYGHAKTMMEMRKVICFGSLGLWTLVLVCPMGHDNYNMNNMVTGKKFILFNNSSVKKFGDPSNFLYGFHRLLPLLVACGDYSHSRHVAV